MTVAELHRLTSALMVDGHGGKAVCINRPSFIPALTPASLPPVTIYAVASAKLLPHPLYDDDGGAPALDAAGRPATRLGLVLRGDLP